MIRDEFNTSELKKVCKIQDIKNLPENKKLIKMRWVFNIKNDERYRSRLVAQEFS